MTVVLNQSFKVESMDMLLKRGVPCLLEFILRVFCVGGCRQEVRVLETDMLFFAEAQNIAWFSDEPESQRMAQGKYPQKQNE